MSEEAFQAATHRLATARVASLTARERCDRDQDSRELLELFIAAANELAEAETAYAEVRAATGRQPMPRDGYPDQGTQMKASDFGATRRR